MDLHKIVEGITIFDDLMLFKLYALGFVIALLFFVQFFYAGKKKLLDIMDGDVAMLFFGTTLWPITIAILLFAVTFDGLYYIWKRVRAIQIPNIRNWYMKKRAKFLKTPPPKVSKNFDNMSRFKCLEDCEES